MIEWGGIDLTGDGWRRAGQLGWLGIVGAALLLTGCANHDDAVALPSPAGPGNSLPSSPASESEAVTRSYTDFIALLDRADSLPDYSRGQRLSALMAEPQLSRVLKRIEQLKNDHLTSYGQVIVHVKSIQLDGDEATLRDCQDSSSAGLENTDTHKKVSRGVKKGNTKALMVKGPDGNWRVSKYIVLGEGC